MTRISLSVAALLAAVLAAGCAGPVSAPPPVVAAASDCSAIGAEIARTDEARRDALQQQSEAWRAVVPFAVAARYAKARSAAGEADERLAALKDRSARLGCTGNGG
jgi:hypothetical protein